VRRAAPNPLTVVGCSAETAVLCSIRRPDQMSPVGRLTADERDRDVPHRRVGLSAMPMAFTGLDVHDVAHVDLTLSCSVATMPEPEVTTRI
jgi:hypothetical protein